MKTKANSQNRNPHGKLRPLVALRAVRRVVNDPEQTAQVFRVIQALSGPSLRRNFKRFAATPTGQQVLKERLNLVEKLSDSDYLRRQPEHSLGHLYLRFIQREEISAGGLEQASAEAGYENLDPDLDLFVRRTRASHDLFHVLTSYGRDPLGEACLLAFTYGQTGNIAFVFILISAATRLYRAAGTAIFSALWRAYRDGKNCRWLISADWENLLARSIEEVRKLYNIPAPIRYDRLTESLTQAAT